jgi:hypothetical protein
MADHNVMFAMADNMALLVDGHVPGIASGQSLCVFFDRPPNDDYASICDESAGVTALLPSYFSTDNNIINDAELPYDQITGDSIKLIDAIPNDIVVLVSPVSISGDKDQMEIVTFTPDGQYNVLEANPRFKNERYYQGDKLYAHWDPRQTEKKGLVWTHNKRCVSGDWTPYLIGTIMHACLSSSPSPIRICVG